MKWEIREVWSPKDELIHIKKRDKTIEWDFIEGSAAQMCVLFPVEGIKTLFELKREGTRPILYHKRLKKSHHIPSDPYCPEAYEFYPGIIENGCLYVGNQREGNVVLLGEHAKKSIVIHMISEKQILGGLFTRKSVSQKTLTLGASEDILYYKLSGEPYTYAFEIKIGRENFIHLKPNQTIAFFRDKTCMGEGCTDEGCTDEVNT